MSVMDWAGTIAAGWLLLSILVAAGWHLTRKRLNREPRPFDCEDGDAQHLWSDR